MNVTERYAQLFCPIHGDVGLTHHEYHEQLMDGAEAWKCPACHTVALFDYAHWTTTHGDDEA
jgi:hypothetical protein